MQDSQTCKVCGRRDIICFHVPDKIWEDVIPKNYRSLVVCLRCFDTFASEKGVHYASYLRECCFVGKQVSFRLKVIDIIED